MGKLLVITAYLGIAKSIVRRLYDGAILEYITKACP